MYYSWGVSLPELDRRIKARIELLRVTNSEEFGVLFSDTFISITEINLSYLVTLFNEFVLYTDVSTLNKTLMTIYRESTPDIASRPPDRIRILTAFCVLPTILEDIRNGLYRTIINESRYQIQDVRYCGIKYSGSEVHVIMDMAC